MIQINITTLVLSSMLLLSGCGNNDSGSNTSSTSKAKSIQEAQKNLTVLSTFESINLSVFNQVSSSQNASTSIQKTINNACKDGGTMSIDVSEDEKTIYYAFKQCKTGLTLLDGNMKFFQTDDNNMQMDYDKLTYKDDKRTQYMDMTLKMVENSNLETLIFNGIVNQTNATGEVNNMKMSNMVFKSYAGQNESWSTTDGVIEFKNKCVTGSYEFKTIEKLVEAKDGSDNLESGVLSLNGATYTFENPYVTIEVNNQSETLTQTELDKRMKEESASCTI